MDLDELRAFMAVAEAGSFLSAAERLGMPRATLRRRVDELEARAGVPLLRRTRAGAELTVSGHALAARATAILEEASALIARVREVGSDPAGLIRVTLPVGLPPFTVTAMLAVLRQRAPRLVLRARVSGGPLEDRLEDTDVVLHFGPATPRSRWVSRPILRMRGWLLASPAYLAARGRPASAADLASHDLLAWDGGGFGADRWPMRDGTEIAVEPVITLSDVHTLRHLAAAGLGIALLPDARIPDPTLPLERLEPVLADVVGRDVELSVSVPAVLVDVPRIRLFLDLATELTAALAPLSA